MPISFRVKDENFDFIYPRMNAVDSEGRLCTRDMCIRLYPHRGTCTGLRSVHHTGRVRSLRFEQAHKKKKRNGNNVNYDTVLALKKCYFSMNHNKKIYYTSLTWYGGLAIIMI